MEALPGMKHADFRIGMEFLTATGRWRVTPYSIVEQVFDEYDLEGCGPVG
jgi:hypothetical protein